MPDRELVEAVARAFHEAYERLAPGFHYDTRLESAVPWERVPDTNRKLMVAVVGEVVPLVEADVLRRVRASIEALPHDELRWTGSITRPFVPSPDAVKWVPLPSVLAVMDAGRETPDA